MSMNTGNAALLESAGASDRLRTCVRVLLLSTKVDPSLAVYPDSDKIGAWPGPEFREDRILVRRESMVDYWDRET